MLSSDLRTVEFETTQVSAPDVAISPDGNWLVFNMLDGRTWSPEIVLRDDGGSSALGYTQTVQRFDGKLVTVYYFNDESSVGTYIAATIWDLGE